LSFVDGVSINLTIVSLLYLILSTPGSN